MLACAALLWLYVVWLLLWSPYALLIVAALTLSGDFYPGVDAGEHNMFAASALSVEPRGEGEWSSVPDGSLPATGADSLAGEAAIDISLYASCGSSSVGEMVTAGSSSSNDPSCDVQHLSSLSGWDVDSQLRQLDVALSSLPPLREGSGPSLPSAFSEVSEATFRHGDDVMSVGGFEAHRPPPSMFRGAKAVAMQERSEESFSKLIPDVLPLGPQPTVAARPSSAFITSSLRGSLLGPHACVHDESGRVILWPWESPRPDSGAASFALFRRRHGRPIARIACERRV